MRPINKISQDRLKELFEYRDDGNLIRKVGRQGVASGSILGCLSEDRYYVASVDYKHYYLHRLIFLWHYGYMPTYIDHIDGNKTNNKISNLREATKSTNSANRPKRADSPHLWKGIQPFKNTGKWRARTRICGVHMHLGLFNTPEDAAMAYNETVFEWFGAFAYLNESQLNYEDINA